MAKVIKGGGFMAGFTPKISDEPAVLEAYKGYKIYSYTDDYGRLKTVMTYKAGSIHSGTSEAYRFKDIELMRTKYKLTYVMTVGEVK